MRRLSFLVALMALTSAVVLVAGGDAEGKTRRRKLKPGAHPAAAEAANRGVAKRPGKREKGRTRGAVHAAAPTSPDVIPRRLMIAGFDGRGAQAARLAAAAALRPVASLRVVPISPADAMRLGTAYGAEKTAGLAQRLNLTAVLYGTIKQAPRDVTLSLLLANGEDGRVMGEIAFQAHSLGVLRAKVKLQLWSRLQPLIDQAASPGRAESAESPIATAEPAGAPAGEVPETPTAREPAKERTAKDRKPPRPPIAEEEPATEAPPIAEVPATPTERRTTRPRAGAVAEVPETSPKAAGGRKPAEAGEEPGAGTAPVAQGEAGEADAGEGEVPAEGQEKPAPGRRTRDGETEEEEEIAGLQAHGELEPRRCSTAELSPGAGVMTRRFNYRAEQRGALRGYSLFRAPVGRIEGTIYPFAGGRCRTSTGFGLRAAYERMGPVSSQLANRELGTQGSAYQAELVLRIVSGRLTLQPAVGFLARQYRVDGDVVPTADYRAIGGGLDAELRWRYLAVAMGASARWIMGAGTLGNADWFPNWSGYAASGHVELSVAPSDWMDVVLGGAAEYELFAFDVDPNAASPNGVAGGAYDLYLQGTLSIRFRLGRGDRKTGAGSGHTAAAGGGRAARRAPGGSTVSSR